MDWRQCGRRHYWSCRTASTFRALISQILEAFILKLIPIYAALASILVAEASMLVDMNGVLYCLQYGMDTSDDLITPYYLLWLLSSELLLLPRSQFEHEQDIMDEIGCSPSQAIQSYARPYGYSFFPHSSGLPCLINSNLCSCETKGYLKWSTGLMNISSGLMYKAQSP